MSQVAQSSGETVIYNNRELSQDYVLYSAVTTEKKAMMSVNKCFGLHPGSLFENFYCFMDSG